MVAVVAFLVLVAFAIPIEHLAFARHPRFANSELLRRAIGISTVMILGLIPVAFGGLDWRAWVVLLAGFLLAGGALALMVWIETRQDKSERLHALRGVINEQIEHWQSDAD